MQIDVRVPPYYDMLSSVHSWIYPDVQPVPEVTSATHLRRLFTIDNRVVPLIIEQSRAGDELQVRCPIDGLDKTQIEKKIVHVLGLDIDTSKAVEILRESLKTRAVADVIQGIRPYTCDTSFEALIKSIIQQQVSYRAANVLTRRLVTTLSPSVSHCGYTFYHFPTAERLAQAADSQMLAGLGLGFKVAYIRDISLAVASGRLNIERLIGASYTDVVDSLRGLRGVGEWTIQTLCIAGLRVFSVFPYADLGIRNLLGRLYGDGQRLSVAQTDEIAQSWAPHGPMVLYLLMCADVLGIIDGVSRRKLQKASDNSI